ncbi:MAG: prefoldin subunit beta [Candidatus Lokiarchaeota archaeon]|nr:prefoldin subunit beta [Candidatus Lokiarchaeota archaeon]
MSQELPQDIQQKIRNFQVLQQNLQSLNEQKYSLEAQLKEITTAKEFLEKAPGEAKIFKSIGGLMVESAKDKAMVDLKENEEIISTRVKKLDLTIEKTKAKFEEMKNDINSSLKNRMG